LHSGVCETRQDTGFPVLHSAISDSGHLRTRGGQRANRAARRERRLLLATRSWRRAVRQAGGSGVQRQAATHTQRPRAWPPSLSQRRAGRARAGSLRRGIPSRPFGYDQV